jgi:hypothetical protein
MLFENKGFKPRRGVYLICGRAKRRLGCPSVRWHYSDFETSFLAFVEEIDIENLVSASSQPGERKRIEAEISALQGELEAVATLMEKTYGLLMDGGAVDFIRLKLNEHGQRKAEIEAAIRNKTAELEALASRDSRYRQSREEIRTLIDRLQQPGNEDLYTLRARVASHLKSLINTLTVASIGEAPQTKLRLEQLRKMEGVGEDIVAHVEQRAAHPDQSRRYFAVGFRDAAVRVVFPTYDDPLRFEQQIVAGQGPMEDEGQKLGQLSWIDVLHPDGRTSTL